MNYNAATLNPSVGQLTVDSACCEICAGFPWIIMPGSNKFVKGIKCSMGRFPVPAYYKYIPQLLAF